MRLEKTLTQESIKKGASSHRFYGLWAWMPVVGPGKLEIGAWKLEVGAWKLEVGAGTGKMGPKSRQPETGGPEAPAGLE